MACLDTYKSPDKKGQYPPMSPRLSFSKDFVQSHNPTPQHPNTPQNTSPSGSGSGSDDFEFSAPANPVGQPPMAAADKLFFNGKLLPTLRDELLLDHDDDDVSPKGPPKWKDFFTLKRSVVDGRCAATNSQGKIPKLAPDDKPPQIPAPQTRSLLF